MRDLVAHWFNLRYANTDINWSILMSVDSPEKITGDNEIQAWCKEVADAGVEVRISGLELRLFY